MIDQVFILAAGRGERMRPITDLTPKPLVQINGKSMLDRIIEKVDQLPQIKRIIINSHHLSGQLENHIKLLNNPKIFLSKEATKLETGGGLLNAISLFDTTKPLLVINGDIIWESSGRTLKQMIDSFDENKMDILMGLKKKEQFFGYEGSGDFNLDSENGTLNKAQVDSNSEFTFTGIQIIHPRILEECPKPPFSNSYFYKKATQDNGTLKGIKGVELKENFFHIGTIEAKKEVEEKFPNL